MMIAAGKAGRPEISAALGAGEQVVGAELVEAAEADAQFECDAGGVNQPCACLGEEMADEGRGETVTELG